MAVYIGIDPGATGSIAIITIDAVTGKESVEFKNIDNSPYAIVMGKNVQYIDDAVYVAIEKICARPGQHVVATFTQGANYRAAEIIAAGYTCTGTNYPVYVAPQTWTAFYGLKGKTTKVQRKQKHVAKALQIYPQAPIKRHDQADALLIAHWLKCQTEGDVKEC